MTPSPPERQGPAGATGWRARLPVAFAVVTCPCHLPLLAAVLAGTSLGAFVTEHFALAFAASTVLFVLSLVLVARTLGIRRDEQ